MAYKYLASNQSKDFSSVLTSVLNVLSKSSITASDKADLLQNQDLIKNTSKSPVTEFKETILNRVRNYKHPVKTVLQCISEFKKTRKEEADEEDNLESVVHVSYAQRREVAPGRYTQKLNLLDSNNCYAQVGNKFFQVPLDGTDIDESSPLENPLTFCWDDLSEKCLVRTPCSDQIHVLRTLDSILTIGEEYGIRFTELGNLVKAFVDKHLQHFSGSFFNITDTARIFEIAIGLVTYQSLVSAPKKAISLIKREPSDSIEIPINQYKSLLTELNFLENPGSSNKSQASKIERECIKLLDHLVSDNLKNELEIYKKIYYNKYDQSCSLTHLLEFIIDLELQPEFKLTTTKTLQNKKVAVSVYNMETTFVSDSDSFVLYPHSSRTEVHPTWHHKYHDHNASRSQHRRQRYSNHSNFYNSPEHRGCHGPGNWKHQYQEFPFHRHEDYPPPPPEYDKMQKYYDDYGGEAASEYQQHGEKHNSPTYQNYDEKHTSDHCFPVYYRTKEGDFILCDDRVGYEFSSSGDSRTRPEYSDDLYQSSQLRSRQNYNSSSKENSRGKREKPKCSKCHSTKHDESSKKCVYSRYPKAKYLCKGCGEGFHYKNFCLKTYGRERSPSVSSSSSNDENDSNVKTEKTSSTGKPGKLFPALNPVLQPNYVPNPEKFRKEENS